MSQIKVDTINDASGGNNAVLYGPACPDNSMGFRNRIINGDMRIDQRNAGAAQNPIVTGGFVVDRFKYESSQAGKLSAQQNAGSVTPPTGFTKYAGLTSLSSYSVLSSDYFLFEQFIEGFNTADLGWGTASAQTVTLSFVVRSSLTGTFGGVISNDTANRVYGFTYSVPSANTWTTVTVTIPGDTSGTWQTGSSTGIQIRWGLGIGAGNSIAAGSWGTSGLGVTGATSVVGTNGATFYITGVQLEAGSVATPFERRPYGTELSLCQRYFETSFNGTAVPTNGYAGSVTVAVGSNTYGGGTAASQQIVGPVWFKVTKRASPTVTVYSYSNSTTSVVSNGWTGADFAANSGALNGVSQTKFEFYNGSGSNITTGGYSVLMNFAASAEL